MAAPLALADVSFAVSQSVGRLRGVVEGMRRVSEAGHKSEALGWLSLVLEEAVEAEIERLDDLQKLIEQHVPQRCARDGGGS